MLPVGRRLGRHIAGARYETLQGDFASTHAGKLQLGWFAAPGDANRRVDGTARPLPAHLEHSLGRVRRTIESAIERGVPTQTIFIVGHSQGGALAMAAGITIPRTLGGVATIAGYLPWPDARPVADVETPFLLLHAREDPIVSAQWGDYAAERLTARGFDCQLRSESTPATPHAIHRWQLRAIATWINERMATPG
jgi:predicted esterase